MFPIKLYANRMIHKHFLMDLELLYLLLNYLVDLNSDPVRFSQKRIYWLFFLLLLFIGQMSSEERFTTVHLYCKDIPCSKNQPFQLLIGKQVIFESEDSIGSDPVLFFFNTSLLLTQKYPNPNF